MTDTVLSSSTREVVIGFERPFVIIGERINPTGRKALADEMKAGDFSRVERDVLAQVQAGAHMLDVNAGIPLSDEPAILARTIQLVQSLTDLPLSIDSSIVEALEAGLAVYQGKPLVNSVTGEEERLERVLPLIRKYGAAVVAISNDDTGISMDPDIRFAVAKRIVERAADHGIPASDIVVDPLVMPIGALAQAGQQVFALVRRLRRGAQGQHDLWRVERQLRSPATRRDQCGVPADGDRQRHDLGDHQPAHARGQGKRHGGRRPDGSRPRLRPLDPGPPRPDARGRGQPPARQPSIRRAGPLRRPVVASPVEGAATDQPLVIFTPSGRRGRFPEGTTVLDAARSLGVDIDAVCAARGICGRCQVSQAIGSFPKHGITSSAGHLAPMGSLETAYQVDNAMAADRRLSCTAEVLGDVLIDVPPESQVHRQVVRKGLDVRDFTIDPIVRLHYVEVTPPDLALPTGDLGRLFDALEREWGLTGLGADLSVVRGLQPALESGKYGVTVAVHRARQVIAVWPGLHEAAFGVAIDVGSTTIAGHLANLADGAILASHGVMNPQIRFGEDLMSRVSYAMMHPDGAGEMTVAVRKALDGLIATLAMRAGIKRVQILELAMVGNPIMHHLLLGIDPTPLGGAPFALATDGAVETTTAELGLIAHPGARVYLLPCIAGHVGADTAGVILAEQPHQADHLTLVVDVGTNAEIVLGDRRRLLAASSPTGPAFEGAQISGGQRAAPGAIERVRIDRETLEPRFRVIGIDAWSDEPAFAEAIASGRQLRDQRHLWLGDHRSGGRAVPRRRRHRRRRDRRVARRTLGADRPGRPHVQLRPPRAFRGGGLRIAITQNDVRAIQLAKAALYAGVRLLMDQLGVDAVDEIRLAGAFGSQIDPTHAMILGLIPDCDLANVRSAGNAAGTGALIALLSGAARAEIEEVVRRVEKIETAVEPRFQEHFVEAMAFPHRTAAFPNLGRVVPLPERRHGVADGTAGGAGDRAERRRRRVVAAGSREQR